MTALAVESTPRRQTGTVGITQQRRTVLAVEITPRHVVDDEIEFVDDLDELAGSEVMRGCGNDNPY
ncbi:hypothetical protein PH213_16740 [Streptomyces sp. SRF1]|uniref:hypothetical protein n=1 Tax=Streptomyces sp. SRF1 TaxID=1549642 RepID=UPI0025B1386F|nr:hypothetical protein [Streptomyces sp. SRF1]MDN3056162.1 hypothetical protein [Streptomyces sp. SRF1]